MRLLALLLLCVISLRAEKFGDVVESVDIYAFIAEAEEVTLLSIDPTIDVSRPKDEKPISSGFIYGYRILGQIRGDHAVTREGIRNAIHAALTSIKEADGPYLCFDPRHAVRLVRGKQVLDILVCFECLGSEFHFEGKVQSGPAGLGGQSYFNALLDERKIERSKPPPIKKEPNGETSASP